MDNGTLDLSDLKDFSFQPEWSRQKSNQISSIDGDIRKNGKQFENYHDSRQGRNFPKEDKKYVSKKNLDGKTGAHKRFFRKNHDKSTKYNFVPVVDAEFYPEDGNFDNVVSACRLTCKTYELFNIARLFLEKPERFVVVIKKRHNFKDSNLYLTVDDELVFLSKNEAVRHVLEHHIEKYFTVKEQECEVPKGTFVCIHKCGLTGRLLCPPNYHKYQELLIEHHERYLSHIPFECFKDHIEKISDQTVIDDWKAQASKVKVFIPKIEGCDTELTRYFDVKQAFLENFKECAIKSANSFRIKGEALANMPRGILRKSLFYILMREKRFPLGLANNLRGKLRRAHFTIYKIQTKKSKISCACAVRRKFRSIDDKFEGDIQKIIDYIDDHKNVKASDLYNLVYPDAQNAADGEKDVQFSEFAKNLNWLIHEGYVSEFEDGRLVATIIMSKEQIEAMKKSENSGDEVQDSENMVNEVVGDNIFNNELNATVEEVQEGISLEDVQSNVDIETGVNTQLENLEMESLDKDDFEEKN